MRNRPGARTIFPRMKPILLLAAGALASSCSTLPTAPDGPLACPIIGSSDWRAWVNAMPGPGARPTLIVTGKVTTPSAGYHFSWGEPVVMESYPVQVAVELRAHPPAGPAAQVVTTSEVRGQWPMDPPVGSVTVRCGDRVLARISPVENAH